METHADIDSDFHICEKHSITLASGLCLCLSRDIAIVFTREMKRRLTLRERFLEWLAQRLIDPDVTSLSRILGELPVVQCVGNVQKVRLPGGELGLVFISSQGECNAETQGEIVDLFYHLFIKGSAGHGQPTQTAEPN